VNADEKQHFNGDADSRHGREKSPPLNSAGTTRPAANTSSATPSASQAPCGMALSDGTVCSELENFHAAPITVCAARSACMIHNTIFTENSLH
jgi:hypothetical protein